MLSTSIQLFYVIDQRLKKQSIMLQVLQSAESRHVTRISCLLPHWGANAIAQEGNSRQAHASGSRWLRKGLPRPCCRCQAAVPEQQGLRQQ